jgi:AraC-like DNA-binding protein
MLNKPIVLSTGEWIFPIAYWRIGTMAVHNPYGATSLAYRSVDNGQTFEVIGGAKAPNSSFDEHMFFEKEDGVLQCYIRTFSGIAESFSFDQGKHWTESKVSEMKGPGSRFFIRRLNSGRVLFINHYDFDDRNNLTAMLSDDDGKTWKWKLLLDERKDVSYPDAKEDEEGYIHITYDRERGDERHSLEECYKDAREILYARIKEEDIIAGEIVSEKGLLKGIISKLGKYEGEDNLFNEPDLYTDTELAKHLLKNFKDKEIDKIFEFYPVKCINMGESEWTKLDQLIEEFNSEKEDKVLSLAKVITLIRSCAGVEEKKVPLIELVKDYVDKNWQENFSMQELAHAINSSVFYIIHQFKKYTGITILEYRTAIRMRKAKEMLQNGDKNISNIASECGFDDFSYFSKLFKKEEGCSPSDFRERFKK